MKIKVWFALVVLVVCTSAFAADAPKQPQMTPEQKAMMDAWTKYMTPSEGHKALAGMIGTWNAKVSMWMQPGAPPVKSSSTETDTWIMGGRYVQTKVNGTFMGKPFTGMGVNGYDNAKKQYFGTWIDNMGTGMMTSWGDTTDGGKTWTYKSTAVDPMTGKDLPEETKITIADKNHHTMEMWAPGPDGKMYKMMEINYTRKK